ncbi:MAG TPA: hypothetical protein VFM18_03070 [Methanosarcina sp.]|nr:hypothetical protein [Methanosarcina sp.]
MKKLLTVIIIIMAAGAVAQQQQQEKEFNIKLKLSELNLLLNVIDQSEAPHSCLKAVSDLIVKQAQAQLAAVTVKPKK